MFFCSSFLLLHIYHLAQKDSAGGGWDGHVKDIPEQSVWQVDQGTGAEAPAHAQATLTRGLATLSRWAHGQSSAAGSIGGHLHITCCQREDANGCIPAVATHQECKSQVLRRLSSSSLQVCPVMRQFGGIVGLQREQPAYPQSGISIAAAISKCRAAMLVDPV